MSNPTKIISFGSRHGLPPTDCTVIDVRPFFSRNPWRQKNLRNLTGLDPRVAEDIQLTPGYVESYRALRDKVARAGKPTVALGCTGGRHRSVYLAYLIGLELGIPVEHRDINKTDFPNPTQLAERDS